MPELFGKLPQPTPETQHFWAGTREGRLLLQRCVPCGKAYFPPRPFCPHCAGGDIEIFEASGRGQLYSYSIDCMNGPDGQPTAVAVVELPEGVRMMSNLREVDQTPEALILDMELEVIFERHGDDIVLPQFRPVDAARRTA